MSAGAAAMSGASAMKNTKALGQMSSKAAAVKDAANAAKEAGAKAKEAALKEASAEGTKSVGKTAEKAAAKVGKEAAKSSYKSALGEAAEKTGNSAIKSGIKKFGADDLMELGGQLQQLGAMLPQKQNNSATGVNNRGFSGSISKRRKIA
jgi:phosphosulfolactate synthase (CoM biosynthesis protein A)